MLPKESAHKAECDSCLHEACTICTCIHTYTHMHACMHHTHTCIHTHIRGHTQVSGVHPPKSFSKPNTTTIRIARRLSQHRKTPSLRGPCKNYPSCPHAHVWTKACVYRYTCAQPKNLVNYEEFLLFLVIFNLVKLGTSACDITVICVSLAMKPWRARCTACFGRDLWHGLATFERFHVTYTGIDI